MAKTPAKVEIGDGMRAEIVVKSGQRVLINIAKYKVVEEPVSIPPNEVGCDYTNRGGQIPSIMVVHQVIGPDIKVNGYDPTKPKPGVVRQYKSNEGKRKLVKWNEDFSVRNPAFPTVESDVMSYGSVASSHLTLTLRCYRERLHSQITNDAFTIENDDNLLQGTRRGHKYWVLREDTPDSVMMEISEYYNSDNNTMIKKHEMELLRSVQLQIQATLTTSAAVSVSSVIAKTMQGLTVQVQPRQLATLARLAISLGATELVDEICQWHSLHVNPNELTIFSVLDEIDKNIKQLIVKCCLVILSYCPDSKVEKVRPNPDVADFLKSSDIKALSSRPEELSTLETFFQRHRMECMRLLRQEFGGAVGYELVLAFEHAALVTMLNKKPPGSVATWYRKPSKDNNKITEEVLTVLHGTWKRHVQSKFKHHVDGWVYQEGLLADDNDDETLLVADVVDYKTAEKSSDDASIQKKVEAGYTIGRKVKLSKRITVDFPNPNNGGKPFRKDVLAGDIGKIVGFPKEGGANVRATIEFEVEHESITNVARMNVLYSNMKLVECTSGAKDVTAASSDSVAARYSFLKGDSDASAISIVDFNECAFHDGSDTKMKEGPTLVRSLLFVGMHLANSLANRWTKKDIVLCNRAGKLEVWTMRDFAKNELVLHMYSHELKERYWTFNRASPIEVHKSEFLCRHTVSTNKFVVVDGRLRASAPPASSQTHANTNRQLISLFFAVERTDKPADANMEHMRFTFSGSMTLSSGVKKIGDSSDEFDNVLIPALVNPKPLKSHTRLVTVMDPLCKAAQKIVDEVEAKRKAESAPEPKGKKPKSS